MKIQKYSNPNLTTYDLVKTLALFLMVIDHVGYFFFPENLWFRVIGRASMPIWLFLIGYARSRDLSPSLWIGSGLLIAASFIFGGGIFPLSILVTILICRFVLDAVTRITFRNWEAAIYGTFVLALLIFCTYPFFEYGTSALLIAMAGYVCRNKDSVIISIRAQKIFMGSAVALYCLSQIIIFSDASEIQKQATIIAIGAASLMLYFFRGREAPEVEERLPGFVTAILKICGRYTLEFYVLHLILIKLILCLQGANHYGWFQWSFIR